jgi:lipoprotein-anchoring transpeptidase ErfK/SrfK
VRDSKAMRGRRWRAPAGSRAKLGITVVFASLGLLAAACSGSPAAVHGAQAGPGKEGAAPAAAANAAKIKITPANGRSAARPNRGIAVSVADGKLQSVVVTAGSAHVSGTLATGSTSWHTKWPLRTGTHYRVTAVAVGSDGKTVTQKSSFRTLTPQATFTAQTILGYHQTYGVGIPITINFSSPVTHRAAVERAIQIKSSKPVVGAWMWDGNQSVSFRTRSYWPQNTQVSFVAHFNGVETAPGVYGTANLSQSFQIGRSLIVVASTRTHYQMVYYRNKLLGRWPISTGMPGKDTANGTYLTIEKANPTRMKGNGYNVLVPDAVRFTWSGNYEHWADWSVAQQGVVNVSHGCVNLSPAHAATYYKLAVPGDPVTITGSPVAGQWDDGWTQWFDTFKQVLRRSATHKAVEAGPDGSQFVDPSTLPPPAHHSSLYTSKPHNYVAR